MDQKTLKLISEAKRGDPDAFTALMQSQMQNMYKAARAILSSDEDAADAIADTILVCWEKLSQLRKPEFFRTWMTRILINKCKDIIRKRRNYSFMEDVPDVSVRETGFENVEWNDALNCLEEKYRLVTVLYYVEGFSTTEIAEMLGMPDSTIRSRLSRARHKLAREFV